MAESTNYIGVAMGLDVTDLKAGITEANKQIQLANSEFKAASSGMDDWRKSTEGITAKVKQLDSVLSAQQSKLKGLQAEYEKVKEEQGENSEAARNLQIQINNQKSAVNKTEKELNNYKETLEKAEAGTIDLEDVTLKAGNAVEKAGEQAEDAGDGFTVAKGAVAGFIANGLTALVGAAKEALTSLFNLAEQTREYREDMGKLETAFQAAGKSTELATNTYKEFYSVLGEEDRSVEAVNHLAKFVDTEEDMVKWTNIAAGVWGTFGDSLPIEGLTEAANETVKTGQVTGVLADALNWAAKEGETFGITQKKNIEFTKLSEKELKNLSEAERESYEAKKEQYEAIEEYNKSVAEATSAEDKFNIALEACTTEQERQKLILDTLNGMYDEAGDLYKENNKDIIKARKATSDYTDTMADLGEEMEPVNAEVTSFKSELAKQLFPVVKNKIIPAIKGFFDKLKEHKVIDKVTKGVEWLTDNFETLVKIVGTGVTIFGLFKGVLAITSTITAVTGAVSGLTAGIGFATKAQTIWNTAMSANPIGAVLTAVGLLAGGIAALVLTQDKATTSTDLLSESQREVVTAAQEAGEAYRETKAAADEMAAAELANIDHTRELWSELQTLADANGKVKEGEEGRANFILKELNKQLGTEYSLNDGIITQYGDMKTAIDELIATKRAEILLQAYEETYTQAITKKGEAEKARAIQAQELTKQEDVVKRAFFLAEQARLREQGAIEQGFSAGQIARLKEEADELDRKAMDEAKILRNKRHDYQVTEEELNGYYRDIANYEQAHTLILEGETDKGIALLDKLGGEFQTVASTAGLAAEEQKKVLEQQVIDTEVNAQLMKAAYEQGVEGVTEEMVATAKEQADKAKEEFKAVGGDITKGIAEGAEEEEWTLTGSMKSLIDKAVTAAKNAAGIKSPSRVMRKKVGVFLGQGAGVGVLDSIPFVKKQIDKFNDYVSDNLGNVKTNAAALAYDGVGGVSVGNSGKVGNGGYTVVNAGMTVNYNGTLSRRELKRLENDNYTAIKTKLKAEGKIK